MSKAELSVILKLRDELSAGLKKAGGLVGDVGHKMTSVLKVGALGAAAGIGAAGYALKGFVEDAMESQKVMAQTNAVIKSTNGVSGMTAKSVSDLAESLSKVIPIDDELIQQTENMLLTFTKIGKDVFPGATEAALDMSIALGEDSVASAMRLGKALNDPIQGVTALRRVGVQLTDAQEEQIKSFMAVNDIAGAQGVILKELSVEFGNSGRAAGDTFAGKMKILSTQIGNVKEGIGMALLPVLTKLADFALARVVPAIEDGVQALTDFSTTISASLTGDVNAAAEAFNKLPAPLQDVALWLGKNKEAITEWVTAAAEIAKTVAVDTFNGWKTILIALLPKLQQFGQYLLEHKPILIALAVSIAAVLALLVGWPALILAVIVAVGVVTEKIQEWRKENELLDDTLKGIGITLQGLAVIIGLVSGVVQAATGFIDDHKSAQIALTAVIAAALLPITMTVAGFYAIANAADWARGILERLTGPMEWVRDRAYWIRDAFWAARDAISSAIDKLNIFNDIPIIGGVLNKVGDAVSSLPGPLHRAMGGPASGLTWVGEGGPELLDLPRGSRVYSSAQSAQIAGQPGATAYVTLNLFGDVPQRQSDRLFGDLMRKLRDEGVIATLSGPTLPVGIYSP